MAIEFDLSALDRDERARFDTLVDHLHEGSLPGLPPVDPEILDPAALEAPEEWHAVIRFLRTFPFRDVPGVIGVGLGHRTREGEATDELAAVVLVRQKRPADEVAPGELLPTQIEFEGETIAVDVQTGVDPTPLLTAGPGVGAFPRATSNCSGAALAARSSRNPCAEGSLTAHLDGRALCSAHVALGFGFEDFIAGLPASLLWLFDSPSGAEMIASGPIQVGQDLHRLFEVDTPWPVLVPLPIPVPGGIALLFVDGAAGDVNPVPIQPFPAPPTTPPFSFATAAPPLAPEGATRFGGTIRTARLARPGESCFKDGQTTGMTFGTVWLPFFQFYLPVPLGFASTVVIVDLVLCRLVLAPGDSGAAVLADDHHYLGQAGVGLPPFVGGVGGTPQPGVTCPVDGDDLLTFTLATPYYLQERLLRVNLS